MRLGAGVVLATAACALGCSNVLDLDGYEFDRTGESGASGGGAAGSSGRGGAGGGGGPSLLAISPGVAVGSRHGCALDAAGTVRCWGAMPGAATAGDDVALGYSAVAHEVADLGETSQIAAGAWHTCALLRDRTVRCWGDYATGDGRSYEAAVDADGDPARVSGIDRAVRIAAGEYAACALLDDGTVSCWGIWSGYQPVPVTVDVSGAIDIAVGAGLCAVLENHTLWCDGTILELTNVAEATLGPSDLGSSGGHRCALFGDGTVKCWGHGEAGQLGDGLPHNPPNTHVTEPVTVVDVADATHISAGDGHVCALLGDASAKCWGRGVEGQLGDGSFDSASAPVDVELDRITSIGAGQEHTCALRDDGEVWCWGSRVFGSLGDGVGDGPPTGTPVRVVGIP